MSVNKHIELSARTKEIEIEGTYTGAQSQCLCAHAWRCAFYLLDTATISSYFLLFS